MTNVFLLIVFSLSFFIFSFFKIDVRILSEATIWGGGGWITRLCLRCIFGRIGTKLKKQENGHSINNKHMDTILLYFLLIGLLISSHII